MKIVENQQVIVESLKCRLKVILSCHVSSTILVVDLVIKYLSHTRNQDLRIIEILADPVVGLKSRL